jgi:threonine dehydrogenase-like Zn-dependent dehydrogenase
MARLLCVPPQNLVLAEGLTVDECAAVEFLAIGAHAVQRGAVTARDRVLVVGTGPIGLGVVLFASATGAEVAVFDHDPERAQTAAALAEASVLEAADQAVEAVQEITSGEGFDNVIDALGSAATLETAISLAARGGRILVFGVAPPGEVSRVHPNEIFSRELTIVGSLVNPYTHERAVSLLPQMMLDRLRLAAFPLARFSEAFEAPASGGGAPKVLLLPQE